MDLKKLLPQTDQEKVPQALEDRVTRGRERLSGLSSQRNEFIEFWRGNQYWYVDHKGVLQLQDSGRAGVRRPGKPSHRVKQPHNLLVDIVAHEVSACTQKTPSYQVIPSTNDPEDVSAARLADKVALFGHDKWRIRDAMIRAVTTALVADESFIWPHWDTSVGPFIQDEGLGIGEVKIDVYGGNQVFWEPGQRFEDSRWHAVDFAMPPEEIMQMEGYLGGKLSKDADALLKTQRGLDKPSTEMTLVTYYLERPCPKYPVGRWLTLANGRQILPEAPYPTDGERPCLHKLAYIIDPDSDRDMGLVRHLIEAQVIYNNCWNKMVEWQNMAAVGQTYVQPGVMRGNKFSDEPGASFEVPQPKENIVQKDLPPFPAEMFTMLEAAQGEMARIAAQNDVPEQIESAKAIGAIIERDSNRRQSFIANLAEVYSNLMHDCLVLVSKHYTEPRLLKVKGRNDWARIADFRGAKLRNQVDVRVAPESIERRSRQAIRDEVLYYANAGWISGPAAMHAISTNSADKLIEDVNLDVARANRVVVALEEGAESLYSQPETITGIDRDGTKTGVPGGLITAPAWMPRESDNIPVWKSVMENFFKTESFERMEPKLQESAHRIYDELLNIEQQEQMEQMMQQDAAAEAQGMQNASKPQGPKALPDQAGLRDQEIPTRNQPANQSLPQEG